MGRRYTLRRHLPEVLKQSINKEFQHRCTYCWLPLGSVLVRRGRYFLQEPNYDHFKSLASSHNNNVSNYVLSCSVCNVLKGDGIYESLDAVTLSIASARERFTTVWETPVSMTEDLYKRGVKYASWLASGRTRIAVEKVEEDFDA